MVQDISIFKYSEVQYRVLGSWKLKKMSEKKMDLICLEDFHCRMDFGAGKADSLDFFYS